MKALLAAGVFGFLYVSVLFGQTTQMSVANAASYQQSAGIAPGSLITVFGQNLSTVTQTAPDSAHLPKTLGGVTLTVNEIPCGIYYISPGQISAQVDPSVPAGLGVLSLTSPVFFGITRVTIEPFSSAGIFTLSGTGSGDGAILDAVTFAGGSFNVSNNGIPAYLALFLNGLDPSAVPSVSIGGIPARVVYAANHPLYQGLQQMNVQLPPQLAGAGRVPVVVEQKGRRSNAVDVSLLPQQGVFPDSLPNQVRSRELASIAWVPGTSLALAVDENDDVVRVLDLKQRSVTRVIALPDGAQPVAVGVWGSGTQAVVAERGRGSIALVDLTANVVKAELRVGRAPSAIAVSGDIAAVTNSDSDSASFFNFRTGKILGTGATGRLPRGVAADRSHAYVTNESDGSITVLDLGSGTAVSTLKLGTDIRPGAIQVLPDEITAVVADATAGPEGRILFVHLLTGKILATMGVNPERTGGASSMVQAGNRIYLANQTGGSVTVFSPNVSSVGIDILTPLNLRSDSGPRALTVDSLDNWLLVANQGSGTISVFDLESNSFVKFLDGLRVAPTELDDHADRLAAPNLPVVNSVAPGSSQVSTVLTLTINGRNLNGATAVLFLDPQALPKRGKGNEGRGQTGDSDPGIVASNIQVNDSGTQLTAEVQVGINHAQAVRLVRVLTPNGETRIDSSMTFSVKP